MTRTRVLAGAAWLALLGACYGALEWTVRATGFPDAALSAELDAETAPGSDARELPACLTGWDRPVRALGVRAEPRAPERVVLFAGDSVTYGQHVEPASLAYPARLAERFPRDLFWDASVPGFGVDQMLLKLEAEAPGRAPDLAVFAYIPHDLWRAGRDVNWGLPKPVLEPRADGSLALRPALSAAELIDGYGEAKHGLRASLWALRHFAVNRRYYLAGLHGDFYRALFRGIRARLEALAQAQRMDVAFLRLPSAWPGAPVPALDALARASFAAPDADGRLSFLDVEPCVRARAERERVAFETEFEFHPSAAGHAWIADCVEPMLRGALEAAAAHSARRAVTSRPAR